MGGLQHNFGRGSAGLDRLGLNLKLFTAFRIEIKVVLVALFGINADTIAAFLQGCFSSSFGLEFARLLDDAVFVIL